MWHLRKQSIFCVFRLSVTDDIKLTIMGDISYGKPCNII